MKRRLTPDQEAHVRALANHAAAWLKKHRASQTQFSRGAWIAFADSAKIIATRFQCGL